MKKSNLRDEAIKLYNSGVTSATKIKRELETTLGITISDTERRKIQYWTGKDKRKSKALVDECDRIGLNVDDVTSFWHKGKHFSIHSSTKKEFKYEDFRDDFIAEISKLSPVYRTIERKPVKDGHCMLFDPADIHIGKLCSSFETGEDYNQQIAVQRVREGLAGIIQKSHGWNIDKIIFIAGNDILHTDTPRRTTTSGTPQDTDGMWYDNFLTAKKLLVEIIETLMMIADVEVVYNPSNHDYMSGFMLLDSITSWFKDNENVTFKADMAHRKYSVYGKNLIGTTHMDGAKVTDLPMLMAHEASEYWHECIHRYIFGHHVHHKSGKDYMSVNVETLRSSSGTDSWHSKNGYKFSPKAIEAFLFHKEYGQVARLSHVF